MTTKQTTKGDRGVRWLPPRTPWTPPPEGEVYASTHPDAVIVPLPGERAQPQLSPAAEHYARQEERWQRLLRRRRRSGRSQLDLAKAKRTLRGDGRAYTDGSDAEPLAGYTQLQVDELGRKGAALMINGKYSWPVTCRRDLINCLAAWRQLRPGKEASTIKAWLKSRAVALRLELWLPASWLPAVPTPIGERL